MNISEPFIRRPVATTLLTSALLLAGVVAYRHAAGGAAAAGRVPDDLGRSATLPGASPETMASAVATPLERQFGAHRRRHRDDVDEPLGRDHDHRCSSTSTATSTRAARDVQAAINAARSQLPPNLPNNPTYRKVNPADAPIMILVADLGHRAASGRCTTRPTRSWRRSSRRSTASAR